jgi:hypothetical protein
MAAETDPIYFAKDGVVWKRAVSRREDARTVICIGFPICKMHDAVGDAAAEVVAALMNAGHETVNGAAAA